MSNEDPKNLQSTSVFFRFYKIITAVLIIVISALSYYFILGPKYYEISDNDKYNTKLLQEDLANREEHLKDLEILVANYKKINQKEIDKVRQILPTEADFPGLFVQLQALAEKYNYRLSAININKAPESVSAESKIQKLSVGLNLVGSEGNGYPEIKNFLSGLEDNLRLFDVSAVYFKSDSPDFSVNIFTYYY